MQNLNLPILKFVEIREIRGEKELNKKRLDRGQTFSNY
jgi:hypothetical protein